MNIIARWLAYADGLLHAGRLAVSLSIFVYFPSIVRRLVAGWDRCHQVNNNVSLFYLFQSLLLG